MSDQARTNGFRIRTLNQDCDRLAVQSSVSATWFCTYKGKWFPKRHEVGIAQSELIVMRPYRGKPVVEITGLGGPHGVLICTLANGGTHVLRNGSKHVFELDAALVIKTERWAPPNNNSQNLFGV